MRKLIYCLLLFVSVNLNAQPISSTALLFNGIDNHVPVSNTSLFYGMIGPTFPFTIEAWIRDDGTAGSEQVILCNRGLNNGVLEGFKLSVLLGKLAMNGPTGAWWLEGVNLADGVCHHVAVVRNADGSWDAYIDGYLYPDMQGDPGDLNSSFPLIIGAQLVPPFPSSYFEGGMKEIRVWGEARTQNQINANMNTVLNTTSAPMLVDYWRLNEGTGSLVYNSSPNFGSGFISTISGAAGWTTSCSACEILPQAPISAAGPLTFCAGQSVILSTPNVPGNSYQWRKYGNDIPGATLSYYAADKSGKYKVVVTNFSGCSKASAALTVTVNTLPPASASAGGPLSFCNGGSVTLTANAGSGYTYQWRKYGNIINGATNISYTATQPGKYKCIVTNTNGCSRTSNTLTVTVPCREGLLFEEISTPGTAIFPNPSHGDFTITTDIYPATIKLFDVTGKEVSCTVTNEAKGEYSLKGVKNGFYLVEISGENVREMIRVVRLD